MQKTLSVILVGYLSIANASILIENDRVSATFNKKGDVTHYKYDQVNNLICEGEKIYKYSDTGALIEIVNNGKIDKFQYDDNGRLSTNGIFSISYDTHTGMMESYQSQNIDAKYKYDQKSGLRISKILNGEVRNFKLDKLSRVIEENDASGNTISKISWKDDLPYTYTINGETYFYHCNQSGDVFGLSDASGNMVNKYSYDVWGKLLNEEETVPNAIRFKHEYYDTESGYYYLRGRYYDPATRRFTTPDPAEDGINWYAYCGNNPIDYVDPSGYKHFRKQEKIGKSVVITEYFSGEDLLKLYNTTSAKETIQKAIWNGIISSITGLNTVWSFANFCIDWIKAGVSDDAQKAYSQKVGLILESSFEEGGMASMITRILSKTDTTAYDNGKKKL